MAGVSAQDLARALEERGVVARLTGPDAVWTRVGEDYQAELRLKGGVWWLDTPSMGEITRVTKVVGKAATSEVEQMADRVVSLMRQHWPVPLPGVSPTVHELPVVDSELAGTLGELAAVLTGPAGLGGQLRWESGPGWTHLVMTGVFGSMRLSTDGYDYFLDLTPPGGSNQTFVIGRAGDEQASARRGIAAVRALVADPRRVVAHDTIAELYKVLAHLPDRLGAQVVRTVGGEVWISVPGSAATRAATVGVMDRLVLGEVAGEAWVFGSLGATPAAVIAAEVVSRLGWSAEEREYDAEAWSLERSALTMRLGRLAEGLGGSEDSAALRGARARVAQAGQEVADLERRGGREALFAARGLVDELESLGGFSSRGAPPPQLVRQWADAEGVAAAWMEWLGFGPAQVCGGPGDGGVDVRAQTGVAQVKDYGTPISAGPVRELAGVAMVEGRQAVFFARSGYTRDAVEFADRAGIALFEFNLQGTITASNVTADKLMSGWG